MCERVAGHPVALVHRTSHDTRVPSDLLPDHKERGLDVLLGQNVQQSRSAATTKRHRYMHPQQAALLPLASPLQPPT